MEENETLKKLLNKLFDVAENEITERPSFERYIGVTTGAIKNMKREGAPKHNMIPFLKRFNGEGVSYADAEKKLVDFLYSLKDSIKEFKGKPDYKKNGSNTDLNTFRDDFNKRYNLNYKPKL